MNWLRMSMIAAVALAGVTAQAKDDALLADMVAMEKAYINPLFFTSNMHPLKSKATMTAFEAEWKKFSSAYREYRPDEANWGVHFGVVDRAIAEAWPIINKAAQLLAAKDPSCVQVGAAFNCPILTGAHDALEAVRYEMADLRIHNGFPKFITDKLTAYHDPMEAIVLTFKGRKLADISPDEIAALAEYFDEAIFAWTRVEATPIDADVWGFSAAQMKVVADRIALEGATLEKLAALYDAGNLPELAALSMSLKQNFVPVYTSFAGDPLLNKLPQ